MRNIQELLKTQVISPTTNNTSSISHALHLHEELEQLKKQNESLKEENKKLTERNQSLIDGQGTYTDLIADLEKDLKSADEKHLEQQRKLQDQLKTLQLAWDSLYDDLDKVKKERDGLRTKLDEVVRKGTGVVDDDSDDEGSTKDLRDTLKASVVSPRTPNTPRRSKSLRPSMLSNLSLMQSPMPEESPAPDVGVDQAAFLRSSLQKQHSSSSLFASAAFHMFHSGHGDHAHDDDENDDDDDRSVSSGIASIVSAPFRSLVSGSGSGNDKKMNDLECENLKLRSTIVRLQTQFRDEKYRNSHPSDKSNASDGDDGLLASPSSSASLSKLPSPRRTMSLQTRSGTRRGIPARTTPRSPSLVEGGLKKLNNQVPLVVTTTTDAADEADQASESSSSSPSPSADNGNENETRSQTSKDEDRESSSTSVTDSVSSCSEEGEGEQHAIDIPSTTNMDSTTVQ